MGKTDPPGRPTLPADKLGRVNWAKVPGFIEWTALNAPGMTNADFGQALLTRWGRKVSAQALSNIRRRIGGQPMSPDARRRALEQRSTEVATRAGVLPSFLRDLGPKDEGYFVHVKGDCFVTSDWHIPHQKEDLVEHLCQMAKAWRVPTLIINGDFLNQDAFSKWKHHRFNVPWAEEKHLARKVLERLFETFDELVYILDNHDRRLIAANEHPTEFTEADVVELLTWGVKTKRLRPSVDYHYVLVNDKWRVTSPKEYRRMKLSLPNRLAQLYHQNIISGGDHLFGVGEDDSGAYVIANSMCLVNPDRTPYISVQDTTYPHWRPGFFMIRDNRLTAFPDRPDLTNWDEAILLGQLLGRHRDRKKVKR